MVGDAWGVSLPRLRKAALAGILAQAAWDEAEKLYPGNIGGGRNQEGDAFRHAYWNATMARTLGPELAKTFADANEISRPGPIGERQMDLYNNRVGRSLADEKGSASEAVKKAIANGRLRTRPF